MSFTLVETIIEYNLADFEAWKRGDKKKLILDQKVPEDIYNQPNYHFGEYFVLNYFIKARWQGYVYYALSNFEPTNSKYKLGREKISELFPSKQLEKFRTIRAKSKYGGSKGEPDLFLYMTNGPKLFLEVKKDQDKVSAAQLECLAQIKGILNAEIGIIRLIKYGSVCKPKEYEITFDTFEWNTDK